MKSLIKNGSDVDTKNGKSQTPLMWASENGKIGYDPMCDRIKKVTIISWI